MKNPVFSLLFLLLLAAAGCTKIIDLPGTQQQDSKRLVVNAVITPDTNLMVYVSRNYSIIGKTPTAAELVIRDAVVEVYEDDVLFATLTFQDTAATVDPLSSFFLPGKLGYFGPANKIPSAGKSYTVKVTHPNYPTATGTTVLPVTPEITGASVRFNAIIDADQQKLSQVTLKFGSISPSTPYIAVAVGGYTTDPLSGLSFLSWLSPAYNQNPGGSIAYKNAFGATDQSFGTVTTTYIVYPAAAIQQGELSFYVYSNRNGQDSAITQFDSTAVYVAGCDKPYGSYITRLQSHLDSQDPGVAFFQGEKLPMLNNIANGYGIWGAYSMRSLVVK